MSKGQMKKDEPSPPYHLVQLLEQNLKKEPPTSYFLPELCTHQHAMKAEQRTLFGETRRLVLFILRELWVKEETRQIQKQKQERTKKKAC